MIINSSEKSYYKYSQLEEKIKISNKNPLYLFHYIFINKFS